MQSTGSERFAPLAGVLFLALVIVIFALSGDSPDPDASTAETVAYWTDSSDKEITAGVLGGLAGVVLIWFGASLRDAVVDAEGGTGRLGRLAFAGTVVAGVGLMINGTIEFAAAESAGDVPGGVTHALSALFSGFFLPLTAGFALTLFALGLAALRTPLLPAWSGWVQIVAGILLFTPIAFFPLIAMVLWIAALGVILFQRGVGSSRAAPA
jgi:hypothetical protein